MIETKLSSLNGTMLLLVKSDEDARAQNIEEVIDYLERRKPHEGDLVRPKFASIDS